MALFLTARNTGAGNDRIECQAGLDCDFEAGGVCKPDQYLLDMTVAPGGTCGAISDDSRAACAPGLACSAPSYDAVGKCMPLYGAGVGDNCNARCSDGLYCDKDTDTCKPALGDPCDEVTSVLRLAIEQ